MNDSVWDWGVAALGAVALALAVWLAVTLGSVRSLAAQTAKLNADVTRGTTLAQVNNSLVQLLARTAAEKNDSELRTLLQANGVTFKVAQGAPSPALREPGQ